MDLVNELVKIDLLDLASRDASANGTGQLTKNFATDRISLLLDSTAGGVGGTLDVKIQTSDALAADYTDVAGAAFAQVGNAVSTQEIGLEPLALKKYVRAVATIAGGGTFVAQVKLIARKENL